jgi:hypothetical protein
MRMTRQQYRDALDQLALTQVGMARLIGISDITSRRWARHGAHGPGPILIRLLVLGKIKVGDIEKVYSDRRAGDLTIEDAAATRLAHMRKATKRTKR